MSSTTTGQQLDEEASYELKADWAAISLTKAYLFHFLDPAAKAMLERWFETHPRTAFYRKFFHRYAAVFQIPPNTHPDWNCDNPSACAVALMRDMTE